MWEEVYMDKGAMYQTKQKLSKIMWNNIVKVAWRFVI